MVVRRGKGPNRLLRGERAEKSKDDFEKFVDSVNESGGKCTAIFGNGTVPEDVARIVKQIEDDIGPITFIVSAAQFVVIKKSKILLMTTTELQHRCTSGKPQPGEDLVS